MKWKEFWAEGGRSEMSKWFMVLSEALIDKMTLKWRVEQAAGINYIDIQG